MTRQQPIRLALPLLLSAFASLTAQTLDKSQRERGIGMLHEVADAVRKHYYDPSFHGVDFSARVKEAEDAMQKAENNSQVFSAIAYILQDLNDSHTFFDPPSRATSRDFGYVTEIIGDACYVTDVRPGSDAAQKLSPGDRVVAINGVVPARNNMWAINYAFNRLFALPSMQFQVIHRDGTQKTVEVQAKMRQNKRVLDLTSGDDIWQLVREDENAEHLARQRYVEFKDTAVVWKMPEFDMTDDEAEKMLKIIRKHEALVLDLRSNPGGLVRTLQYLVGGVMDHDVTIAARKGRKSDMKPIVAKKHGGYSGKIVVLVDSRSASAAELFARVLQLENRGTVIGDLSSGHVMESRYYELNEGVNTKIFYGVSITDADLTMKDGKSLEHVGVTPDERVLPTAADLAEGRDPALARAMELAGVKVDAAAAGKMFPYEWKTN